MFKTQVVEIKSGFIAQVLYEDNIVWESEPHAKGERDQDDLFQGYQDAVRTGADAKANAVARLFTDIPTAPVPIDVPHPV